MDILQGKPAVWYKQLTKYKYMLNIVYPKLYIRMLKSESHEFKYLFIALRPFIQEFQFCRPIIVVDGAQLSGTYKGTFVSAGTLDGAGIKFCIDINFIFFVATKVSKRNNFFWIK